MHALRTPTPRLPPLAFPALCQSGGDDMCCLDGTQLFPGALFPNSKGWAFPQQVEEPSARCSGTRKSAPPSLNAALLQTLGHLGDIVAILGPLRDQLLTLNQHVEQLRGSFDQTVSLAVGFILGSAAAERGVLADPLRE
ncbi:hypothetical protein PANDA_021202 [Ailuropoda melanoleuca]|uniref:Uncharacterized protein n=1 Tax=Ailuropoda melanoleuca TaxID=9646 RepID=D2I640_AILME|nr:hypothetical protein PANDA_021202 [Ailuropoda melanoleuca]